MRRYLIDTAIWIDLYEDRRGYNGEPLGKYAWTLLSTILARKGKIIISDILLIELRSQYSDKQIEGMLLFFEPSVERIMSTKAELEEAIDIARERKIPRGDALHAILARNNGLVLVTRDKHFRELRDIMEYYRPEDLI